MFLKYLIGSTDIESLLVGGGRAKLNAEVLMSIDLTLPNKEEQKHIAIFFDRLDSLITLHQRKYEKLKSMKTALLEKMFPAGNDTSPKIRFKGFTEAWEQRKIGSFLKESSIVGHKGSIAKKLTVKLHVGGVQKAVEVQKGSDNTQYYFRRAGQFIYGKQNFFNGAIGVVPKNLDYYESTKDVPSFDVAPYVDSEWLLHFVARPEVYKPQEALSTGTGSKRFHVNAFYNLEIPLPSLTEQIKIKTYFDCVDSLITLHQRKCEKLKNLKKSLLERMFI